MRANKAKVIIKRERRGPMGILNLSTLKQFFFGGWGTVDVL
jgi:hypothetical protein